MGCGWSGCGGIIIMCRGRVWVRTRMATLHIQRGHSSTLNSELKKKWRLTKKSFFGEELNLIVLFKITIYPNASLLLVRLLV